MKYKVLLAGKNNSTIDDFFTQISDDFESMTTSDRYNDILVHLKYFEPDIFIICLKQVNRESLNSMAYLKNQLEKRNIPVILIGSEEDCNEFLQYTANVADLVLVKPITASGIVKRIHQFMQLRLQQQEEKASIEKKASKEEKPVVQNEVVEKKHVLVVDDDPLMLKMLKRHLEEKYNVATATSGKRALKFLETKKTNIILLDYEMPEENGPAVLEQLHANDATRDIPVLFLTGITEREKIQKALIQKPQGYLLKPINRDKLLETIAKFIG